MIFEILKDAIAYSTSDSKKLTKLTLINVFFFLFIPWIFIKGYCYDIVEESLESTIGVSQSLPGFESPLKMFIKGIKVFLVEFIYGLPSTILLLIGLDSEHYFTTMIVFGIAVGFITYFFSMIAVPHMVYNNGSLKKAFDFKELINIIKSIGLNIYVQLFVSTVILTFGIVSSMLFAITVISLLILFFLDDIGSLFWTSEIFILIFFIITFIAMNLYSAFYQVYNAKSKTSLYNLRDEEYY